MRIERVGLVMSVAVGVLQAWDAGAWAVGATVATLTATALAVVAVTLVVRVPQTVRIGALIGGASLLTVARMISPVSLNALHLALFPAALVILFAGWRRQGRTDDTDSARV